MLTITIDTNCLIDVAEAKTRPNAPFVLELYRQHLAKNVELAITGITASENQLGGGQISNFHEFQQRIVELKLDEIQILKPVRYLGVTFWGWDIFASAAEAELDRSIHSILFPNVPFSYADFCEEVGVSSNGSLDSNWRNKKCDVLAIHSHIINKRDIFVTSDNNFHKETKKSALIALGASEIMKPSEIGGTIYD